MSKSREDKNLYQREYYKTHKKEQFEAAKRWRERHPKQQRKLSRESQRKFREKNVERIQKYNREYMANYRKGKYSAANDVRQFIGTAWRRPLRSPSEFQRIKVLNRWGKSFEEVYNWLLNNFYDPKKNEVNHIVPMTRLTDFLLENNLEVTYQLLLDFDNMEVVTKSHNRRYYSRILHKKQVLIARKLEKNHVEFAGLGNHIQKLYEEDVKKNAEQGNFRGIKK